MTYICISFGNISGSPLWYNQKSYHSRAFTAERHGLDLMPIAGCFGFVVIREDDVDEWIVLEDYSVVPPDYELTRKNHKYSIQPSPVYS